MNWLQFIKDFFASVFSRPEDIKQAPMNVIDSDGGMDDPSVDQNADPIPTDSPKTAPAATQTPTYDWSTPESARHSARVVMDEQGLTGKVDPVTGKPVKDLLCAVIQGESGFNIHAVHHNDNGSYDYGLVQMNSTYWVGPGKLFTSVDEVFANPKKSLLFLIDSYKAGKLSKWYAYTTGRYKQFL